MEVTNLIPFLLVVYATLSEGTVTIRSSHSQSFHLRESSREDNESTTSPPSGGSNNNGQSFSEVLGGIWYVLLVILVVLILVCVFVCACVVKKKRRYGQVFRLELKNHSHNYSKSPESSRLRQYTEPSVPPHTNSSIVDLASMSPGSLSIDPTPIPSPQPSFTSHQSLRSSGHGSGRRKRNHSPRHSSGSEETIRPGDARSTSSLASSVSSMGHAPHLSRTQSLNSAEKVVFPPRGHKGHRRTTSNPLVKVSISGVDDGNGSLRSAPSTSSMFSVSSNQSARSGLSSRSQSDTSSQQTVIEVDVKVHMNPDQGHEARTVMVAALAESARQLAQSAADFGNEEEVEMYSRSSLSPHRPRISLTSLSMPHQIERRHLFASHSSSHLPSRSDYSRPYSPQAVQTVSLDRPTNTASLDRPVTHTFPIQRERYRHDHKLSPSPLLSNRDLQMHRYSPTSSTTSEIQYYRRPPPRQYLPHTVEPRIPKVESETLRRSPAGSSDYHRQLPLLGMMRPFHTLESYPFRPRPVGSSESQFHSLKAPRSQTINGVYPSHSSLIARMDHNETLSGPYDSGIADGLDTRVDPRGLREGLDTRVDPRGLRDGLDTRVDPRGLRDGLDTRDPRGLRDGLDTRVDPRGLRDGLDARVDPRCFRDGLDTRVDPRGLRDGLDARVDPRGLRDGLDARVDPRGLRDGLGARVDPRGLRDGLDARVDPRGLRDGLDARVDPRGLRDGLDARVDPRGLRDGLDARVDPRGLRDGLGARVDPRGLRDEKATNEGEEWAGDNGTITRELLGKAGEDEEGDEDSGREEEHLRDYPNGMDARRLTLPNYYSGHSENATKHPPPPSPTSSSDVPSHVQPESPSKQRRVKQRINRERMSAAVSDPDLRESARKENSKALDLDGRMASIASTSSTIPHSPSTSICSSSRTSSLQSISGDSKKEEEEHDSTLKRQNSEPNVTLRQTTTSNPASNQSRHSKTCSLPRSSSGFSIEGQLSSTASGYAATGSGSSLDTKSFGTPLPHHKPEPLYSYPLQKLLAQPYNPESDDIDLLDPPLSSPYGYHGNKSHDHQRHSYPNHLGSHVGVVDKRRFSSGITGHRQLGNSLRSQSEVYSDHNHANITVEV